jgi:hypothetical protein
MSLANILLGVINIAITVAILIIIGLIIEWFMSWMSLPVPEMIRRVYLIIVALIALYMLVALILGMPSVRFVEMVMPPFLACSARARAAPARAPAADRPAIDHGARAMRVPSNANQGGHHGEESSTESQEGTERQESGTPASHAAPRTATRRLTASRQMENDNGTHHHRRADHCCR